MPDRSRALTPTEKLFIGLMSEAGDNLFSKDADLLSHKNNIFDFLPDGRNSFKNVHRAAQELILAYLDENGYIDINGGAPLIKT